MPLRLASNLLFDSDQENLFEVADIPNNTLWVSARVYKSIRGGSAGYEVWLYEWDPVLNKEKSRLVQSFDDPESAKALAIQISKG
ncbi:MAG: hypothetical protein K2Y18_04590 [Alphaproteobacteria bacterium]|jgi:hypothetical protein|nr:hypothetical protein [Alphaproteobacteria bacterium]